jgi:hypothetical protein
VDRGMTRTVFPVGVGIGSALIAYGLAASLPTVFGAAVLAATVAKWIDEFAYWDGK